MIKYRFIYEETDDNADPDLADRATKFIEVIVSGNEDKTWDELALHFREWLIAIGYPLEGIYFKSVEK